jgi:hypothetical protein
MTITTVGLLVSPDHDPIETARWYVAFTTAVADATATAVAEETALARAARDADDDDQVDESEDSKVDDLVQRWVAFKPHNAERLRAAVKGLRALGYELRLSEPRSSGAGSRTYLRALRTDGANCGYLNSTSFSFVGAAMLVENKSGIKGSGVQPGRYPHINWKFSGSVEIVINVAQGFLAM